MKVLVLNCIWNVLSSGETSLFNSLIHFSQHSQQKFIINSLTKMTGPNVQYYNSQPKSHNEIQTVLTIQIKE